MKAFQLRQWTESFCFCSSKQLSWILNIFSCFSSSVIRFCASAIPPSTKRVFPLVISCFAMQTKEKKWKICEMKNSIKTRINNCVQLRPSIDSTWRQHEEENRIRNDLNQTQWEIPQMCWWGSELWILSWGDDEDCEVNYLYWPKNSSAQVEL